MSKTLSPTALPEALSKSHLRLWLKMLRLCSGVKTVIRERLKAEFNTTLPRFDVMAALYRYQEGLKMSELSSVLRVSNGNVTGIVDRLEQEGFIARYPVAADRRAVMVRLTSKGKKEFEIQAKAHEAWITELFNEVTEARYTVLIEELNVILTQFASPASTVKSVK